MHNESPMVDRIRGRLFEQIKRANLKIPRKGRIRVVLLIVASVTAICTLVMAMKGGRHEAGRTTAAAVEKPLTEKSGPPAAGLGKNPSSADVAAFFSHRPPRLDRTQDTLAAGGAPAVAWYSIDTALQRFVYGLLKQYKPKYGGCAVLDPRTGQVFALVSWHHDSLPDLGGRLYSRSIFPAASIFKTVTAAAAIEKANFSDSTLVPVTGRNHTLYKFQLKKEIAPWSEITLEDAYANSINPVFARLGMHFIGKRTLQEYCRRFGFNEPVPFDLPADSSRADVPDDTTYAMAEFASGFNRRTSLSPLHGACIAAAIAENGAMPRPRLVDSLCAGNACLYRSRPAAWKNPIQPRTAAELQCMMGLVVCKGTARKSFRCFRSCAWSAELEYGGKTGSIESDSLGKIDWFIGYAVDRANPDRRLAVGIVTTHGKNWTVHSSYIASEIFRKFLHPPRCGKSGAARALARSLAVPPAAPRTGG